MPTHRLPHTPTPSPPIAGATASERVRRIASSARVFLAFPIAVTAFASAAPALADTAKSPTIYQCDVNGKKITSDRPIPECIGKDHRELNPDGSLKGIIPPPPTDDERAERDRREREADAERGARNDAIRRDRNLVQRFPSEVEHRKARAKALDDLRVSVKTSEARIALLMVEKKKLDDEKAFYVNEKVNKPLPNMLKQKVDANDALLEAQKSLVQNQQADVVRINGIYDAELARLKKLWAGAPPGSLGPVPQGAAIVPPAPAPAPQATLPVTTTAPAVKTSGR